MSDIIIFDTKMLSYLVSGNIAVSAFVALKQFHLENKLCGKITKIVTALRMKFPDLKDILKD